MQMWNKISKNGFYKERQKWRCKGCGYTLQEENLRPRITNENQIKFQKLVSRGVTFTAIAEAFDCARQTVANIIKKKM